MRVWEVWLRAAGLGAAAHLAGPAGRRIDTLLDDVGAWLSAAMYELRGEIRDGVT